MPYLAALLAGVLASAIAVAPDAAKIGDINLCRATVTSASVGVDQYTGEPVANISLNESGKTALADLTKRNVGRKLAITLNGEVVAEPWVQTEILEGQFTISGPTKQAIERVVNAALAGC